MSDSLPFQNEKARRGIIASFWLVVLCLGVPVWWQTTSIERRGLPRAEVEQWKARGDCPLRFPVHIRAPPGSSLEPSTFASALRAVSTFGRPDSAQVDALTAACINFRVEETAPGLEVSIPHPKDSFDPLGATSLNIPSTESSPLSVLQYLTAQTHSTPDGKDPYAASYAGRYKLLFSLMNEDSSGGTFFSEWEIRKAIQEHLSVTLTQLAPAHNFTIETRVEHFSPITLEAQPVTIGGSEDSMAWVVEESELMAFINEAEWNLASPVSVEPVLHFVLWVPSEDRRPFRIRQADGSLAETNGFIRPRWGSVIIYNPPSPARAIAPPTSSSSPTAVPPDSALTASDLSEPMRRFHSDLLQLIGVSPLPAPLDGYPSVHPLQLESMLRKRILEAAREAIMSLEGIVELAQKQTNMRVGKDVQDQVHGALRELDLAAESLATSSDPLAVALHHARRAKQLANLAFFNPSMLALLYFPDEHKYAVYTPLFGPLAVPMIASVLKEFKAWKKKRREMEDAKKRKED